MNGDEERELMRDIASYLVRTSEQRKVMRRELSDKWCMSVQHLDAFERRNRGTITAIESEIMRGGDIRFAGLWMARQEARIAAYQQAYEELGSELMMSLESRDDDGTEYGSHFEQIRTRSDIRKVRMQILRAVAEELGQLPPRQTVVVVPVQHVVVGVDVEALK